MDLMVKLLRDFTTSFVVTPDQFDKVCSHSSLDDNDDDDDSDSVLN